MLKALQDHLQTMPDKRVSVAFTKFFDRLLPLGTDTVLTAAAGGGQAGALVLNPNVSWHEVTTVATAADSIKLPAALVGQAHFIKNSAAANSMQVFGSGTDTIDSVATATGVPHVVGQGVFYICLVNGNYIRINGYGTSIGYATGTGGAVTQITSRTTGVTLNKLTGKITTDNTSLGAELSAEFTVTNSTVAIDDVVSTSIRSGTNGGQTIAEVTGVAAGSFNIKVTNNNAAGGGAETGAIILNFAVVKAASA